MARRGWPEHVCFVAGTLGYGGAERQLYYQATWVSKQGTKVSVLCLTEGEVWEKPLLAAGIEISYVGRRRSRLWRLLTLAEIVERRRPDLVQAAHFYTNIYASYAGRCLRIPVIGAVRNNVLSEIGAHPWPIGYLSLDLPDVIAANSRTAICTCHKLGLSSESLFYLPNVVDTDQFIARRTTGRRAFATLVWCGRLVAQKRPHKFVRLLHRCLGDGLDVEGIVVGDGPFRPEVEELAGSLRLLPDRLRFLGKVDDMTQVYANADLLVVTSAYEGTPNVVLEAMASGLPVVSTAVGGVVELLEGYNDECLCDIDDEDKLYACVSALIRDQGFREALGRELRQRVVERHSLASLGYALEGLYRRLLV